MFGLDDETYDAFINKVVSDINREFRENQEDYEAYLEKKFIEAIGKSDESSIYD